LTSPSSSSGLPWSANREAPSYGGVGDLGHKGLGELGKRGRRPRGTPGAAHLGRGGTGRWPAAVFMAAGSGSHGRRCSGVLRPRKTAENARPDTARLPAVFIFLRSISTPANRAWPAAARLPVAAQAVDAVRPLGRGRRQGTGCGAALNKVWSPRFLGRARQGGVVAGARSPGLARHRHGAGLRWAPRGPTVGLERTWVGPSGSA
jgi:hypothetical protein